jgi:hypothetical protein
MAVLTQVPMTGPGQRIATPNTLTANDTFTYTPGAGQIVLMISGGGSFTPEMKVVGLPQRTMPGTDSQAGPGADGWNRPIASGAMVAVDMDEMRHYWGDGGPATVSITGASGLIVWILGP